jgi:tight adherence protein C
MGIELLAAILIFATILCAVLAFTGGGNAARARLESFRPRGDGQTSGPGGPTISERLFRPAGEAIVANAQRWLPNQLLVNMEKRLVVAGEPMTLNGFLIMEVICTAVFIGLPLLFFVVSGSGFNVISLLIIAGFAGVGFFFPQIWVGQRAGARRNEVIRALPDAFDLITTCVEAGLGMDAALARVSEKVKGPFADELSRTLREISLGKMRRDALKELAERTDVPDINTFVNAVVQAEQMGSSLGAVLRVQSEQLRVRRRQRAEELAYKAPVKMIFPLVLCIFPTLFIVILGPAIITIMNEFPGSK